MNQVIFTLKGLPYITSQRSRPGVYYSKLSCLCCGNGSDGQIRFTDLLGDDGSLNTLGQIYVGANTVHTQSAPPTKVYHTVNGADVSNQPPVTTWAPYPNSALRGWNRPGQYVTHQMACMVVPLLEGVLGGLWVIL